MNLDLIAFRPQEPESQVKVSSIVRHVDTERLDIVVRIELERGVHLYAEPASEGFEAVSVEFSSAQGLAVGEPAYPVPNRTVDGEPAYGEAVEIVVPVTLSAGRHAQTLVEVQVRYQACTEEACFLPKSERLVLEVQ